MSKLGSVLLIAVAAPFYFVGFVAGFVYVPLITGFNKGCVYLIERETIRISNEVVKKLGIKNE